MAGSEPLLSKDAINIAGHKLPLPVVMALVAIAGIFVVLRARSSRGSVVGAGTVPAPDLVSGGVLGQGQEAQLANLTQQLASIQQSLNPPGPPPVAASSAVPAVSAVPAISPAFLPSAPDLVVPGVPLLPTSINVTHRLGNPVTQLGNRVTQLSTGGDL